MFEAVILLCLGAAETSCREVLLPGAEAHLAVDCAEQMPNPPEFLVGTIQGAPYCRPVAEALPLARVAPGLWVHQGAVAEPDPDNRGDVSNLAVVIGTDSVAVIDSGSAAWMGEALWRAIRERTDLPVSHVILTHMHPDHVFGASVLAQTGAQVVGHAGLPRALLDRQENYLQSLGRLIGEVNFLGTRPPEISMMVEDEMQIDLGDRILALRSYPAAHTGADLTVTDLRSNSLIAGDLLFHRHTPALDGSLRGWQRVMGDLMEQPFDRVIPGHGAASLPWPEGARALVAYLQTLATETRAALDAGERLGHAVSHIAESERPNWQLFDAYNPRNATVAFTELEWE